MSNFSVYHFISFPLVRGDIHFLGPSRDRAPGAHMFSFDDCGKINSFAVRSVGHLLVA